MPGIRPERSGFTLIEVTFATGILFLTLILILGSLAHLGQVREIGERRHLAAICLNHCLEQLKARPGAELSAPVHLPGSYTIERIPTDEPECYLVTVTTRTSRGHVLQTSGMYATPEATDAP